MDIIHVRPVQSAFKDELTIVIDDHDEAVTVEAVLLEANKTVIFKVRTHCHIAVVFLYYNIYLPQTAGATKTNK